MIHACSLTLHLILVACVGDYEINPRLFDEKITRYSHVIVQGNHIVYVLMVYYIFVYLLLSLNFQWPFYLYMIDKTKVPHTYIMYNNASNHTLFHNHVWLYADCRVHPLKIDVVT